MDALQPNDPVLAAPALSHYADGAVNPPPPLR